MALDTDRRRRDVTRTAGPSGKSEARGEAWSFVVQKHDARHLHYDFRLEMDGVLKSWAVTRGPSLVAGERRLAVHVEDHPLEYGAFEGTIPRGEYGGGRVIVWDRGTWTPIGDARRGYRTGRLDFDLHGEKLRGRWHLVRMASRRGERRDNWLLIKGNDGFARGEADPDILEQRPESVISGRLIADIDDEGPGRSSKTGRIDPLPEDDPPIDPSAFDGARRAEDPGFVPPALATLRASPPTGSRWVHEIKFDGYRLQAHISGGKIRLLTRSGLDWTGRFGAAVPVALAALPLTTAIVDGEIVVETAGGASDFSALQGDISEGRSDRFRFYAFDLLYLDGYDLRGCPLVDRKAALKTLLESADPVLAYSEHFAGEGEIILRHACRMSLEGVVSKVRTGKYRSGRSKEWIKSKCSDRQEFVIAGYVPSATSDKAIGSLVLGYHGKGGLVHAGRVGTGFSRRMAEELCRRLEPLRRADSPFAEPLDAEALRGVRFVEPQLVAEVEFRSWTADRLLRHASFRGLREDKPAAEIVREDALKATATESAPTARVNLSHPDRVYWRDASVTKEGLADYYAQVWRFMAPFVVSRPLALLRCPNGAEGPCFFQKHAWKGHHKAILTLDDPNDRSEEPILAIDGLDGLIGLVQAAVLEIHPWQATLDDLEHPDQIVIDIDPGEGVEWTDVINAAREVRARLAESSLESFVKTTGGKGLHVVAPLKPAAGWSEVKAFTRGLAEAMAADSPDRFVATIAKAKRRGRILVDHLRNQRGATAVAPYSTRARAGAPVAMPLDWDELSPAVGPAYFTVANAVTRLANLSSDPWRDFRKAAVPLESGSGTVAGRTGRSR
ncbi:MAG TPA: DNA ligase D [Rhizobiales bacterium]|nr:DNA ligase D [Hyphomicrobiales bacterium]